ncbi:PadR family transcriptional regulator [Actinopolymorpha sp. B17G11]|uniref:PadR family transcriptional regulator n=1 Tax=unclassified Actinopolymorpha TaxID=2627063 RepID=UPI0032D956AD
MSLRALRTPLTMAVLSLLREQPRHPYELQALVRARHIGEVVKLRGGSLYDSVGRLHRAGLVEPVETSRSGGRPERTAYAITDAGRDLLDALVREYVGVPAQEYPVFAAGLAHILNVTAGDAADLLDARADSLHAEIDETDRQLEPLRESGIARVVLLEVEYAQVLRRAELHWLRQIVDAIREGALPWIDGPERAETSATPSDKENP